MLMSVTLLAAGCGSKKNKYNTDFEIYRPDLPFMGKSEIVASEKDGQIVYDTVYQKIPSFSFVNQNGNEISQKDVEGKVYVADFFFTSCPTICPKMTNTLYLVQEGLKNESNFKILSHSIDPDYDSPKVLKEYADKNAADSNIWYFLTGDKAAIYDICENNYMSFAKMDNEAEGGFVHSGFLILVDQNGYVRGAYDGTLPEKSDEIINDVKKLLNEKSTL